MSRLRASPESASHESSPERAALEQELTARISRWARAMEALETALKRGAGRMQVHVQVEPAASASASAAAAAHKT